MRDSLRRVSARVQRLAEATKAATVGACDKPHWRGKVSIVNGDEPAPVWPKTSRGGA
jgi:hypothetical protein